MTLSAETQKSKRAQSNAATAMQHTTENAYGCHTDPLLTRSKYGYVKQQQLHCLIAT
jgi:hypothetical protein